MVGIGEGCVGAAALLLVASCMLSAIARRKSSSSAGKISAVTGEALAAVISHNDLARGSDSGGLQDVTVCV